MKEYDSRLDTLLGLNDVSEGGETLLDKVDSFFFFLIIFNGVPSPIPQLYSFESRMVKHNVFLVSGGSWREFVGLFSCDHGRRFRWCVLRSEEKQTQIGASPLSPSGEIFRLPSFSFTHSPAVISDLNAVFYFI